MGDAIIAGNDDQYRLARDAQHRHIIGLRAAISALEKRLAAPTVDTLKASERKARRKAKAVKGYATQSERFHKQRRLRICALNSRGWTRFAPLIGCM